MLPEYYSEYGRTGDTAKFYLAPEAKYIGKASDHQLLSVLQRIY